MTKSKKMTNAEYEAAKADTLATLRREGVCTRCGEAFTLCTGQFACDANIARKNPLPVSIFADSDRSTLLFSAPSLELAVTILEARGASDRLRAELTSGIDKTVQVHFNGRRNAFNVPCVYVAKAVR